LNKSIIAQNGAVGPGAVDAVILIRAAAGKVGGIPHGHPAGNTGFHRYTSKFHFLISERFPKPGWFRKMLLKKRSKARFFP
jgi:hypothetical protein